MSNRTPCERERGRRTRPTAPREDRTGMDSPQRAVPSSLASTGHSSAEPDGPDCSAPSTDADESPDAVERQLESDPALVPSGPSALLVEPSVLEPEEVAALLSGLGALLAADVERDADDDGLPGW